MLEGKIQSYLAKLKYQRGRLIKSWTHLERKRGKVNFIGGPGESQLELDKRIINKKILKLQKELLNIDCKKNIQRKSRKFHNIPIIALTGLMLENLHYSIH